MAVPCLPPSYLKTSSKYERKETRIVNEMGCGKKPIILNGTNIFFIIN